MSRRQRLTWLGLLWASSTPLPVEGIWPFQAKEASTSKFEGLITIGGLGLEAVSGTLAAFGDWNGDQSTDVFTLSSDKRTMQIYLWNHKQAKFRPSHNITTEKPIESVVPLDFNLDGHLDVIILTQDEVEDGGWWGTKRGILNAKVYLGGGEQAYNKQKPLCSALSSTWLNVGQTPLNASRKMDCRSLDDLCVADSEFGFDLDPEGDSFTSIPVSSLLPGTSSLLFSQPSRKLKSAPHIPLRIGDFNNDGYPDILATVVNSTAAPAVAGIFGGPRSTGVQISLLQNVPCGKKDQVEGGACGGGKLAARRRKLSVVSGAVTDALANIWDARGATWLDIDEDGTLDIVVLRSGKQDDQKITFIKNNIFHDAFFLKALVLNGACGTECEPIEGGSRYNLSQTSYLALQTPYSYFGLGRINNYVENLFVGTSLHSDVHYTNIEGVIPNSYVVLIPPSPEAGNNTLLVKANEEWHKSLFLHPGDWIAWVIMVVIAVVIVLAGVIYLLHQNEKREDELERRKAMHRINFQAL
ncbi:hypothetical protein QFC22_003263 [Naganishia vaughanmartiniae]|uniref:Uncharacterized protein n=1 Tax=Naganishia vaughanmartiniae TaxID=1424756 RepID=A0ACC2X823_9TREE|nr:hypothetical protein QFC22_003263 [Naganishia vaughanmartiniae]